MSKYFQKYDIPIFHDPRVWFKCVSCFILQSLSSCVLLHSFPECCDCLIRLTCPWLPFFHCVFGLCVFLKVVCVSSSDLLVPFLFVSSFWTLIYLCLPLSFVASQFLYVGAFNACVFDVLLVCFLHLPGFLRMLEILGNAWNVMWCFQGFKVLETAWNCRESREELQNIRNTSSTMPLTMTSILNNWMKSKFCGRTDVLNFTRL